jgi:hypothetical protein
MNNVPRQKSTPTREWQKGFLSTNCDKHGSEDINLYEVRCCVNFVLARNLC